MFAVGRVTDPFHAEKIIADKQADMVGMTRANICDPELVAKIKRNEIKKIRPCVGANACVANRYVGKPINCIHNNAVSTPGFKLQSSVEPKSIAVIGGGPAGLEVARVAAERGHQVELFEKHKRLGGQLALWAAAPSMGELGNIIRWRISELERLGVTIHLNQSIDKTDLDRLKADDIVIATGSTDFIQAIPGNHRIQTITPHKLLRADPIQQATNALIINEGRGQAGLAAAELLIHKGIAVEIISSDIAVGADIDPTNRTVWYIRLGEKGCQFSATQIVVSAEGSRVMCRNVYDDRTSHREGIDLIVNWQGCRANIGLSELTATASYKVHYIGDCVSPRTVEIAIGEAEELANNL